MTETIDASKLYVNTFLTERPRDGIDFIQSRVKSAIHLNQELSDYFMERARAEDAYAEAIFKLGRKRLISDEKAFGQLQPIWNMLHNEISQISTFHSEMANIIRSICEKLRTGIEHNSYFQEIRATETIVQRIAKEYDDLVSKSAKTKKKANSGPKQAEYLRHLQEKKNEWKQAGPAFIQRHQLVDENRLLHLKKAIEHFEFAQGDQLLKRVEMSKNMIAAVDSVNIEQEIIACCSAFSAKSIPSTPISVDLPITQASPTSPVPVSIPRQLKPSRSTETASRKKSTMRRLLSRTTGRRRPKIENGFTSVDFNVPPATSSLDSYSFCSTDNHDRIESHQRASGDAASSLNMPSVLSPTSLRRTPSFSESVASSQSHVPKNNAVDADGFSIPLPERQILSLQSLSADDLPSEKTGPRLRVDIATNAIEDDPNAQVALTRVTSLLKEKHATLSRPNGRRGRRALQQVLEQSDPEQSDLAQETELSDPISEKDEIYGVVTEPPLIDIDIYESITANVEDNKQLVEEVNGTVTITYRGPTDNFDARPICFSLSNMKDVVFKSEGVTRLDSHNQLFELHPEHFDTQSEGVVCLEYRASPRNVSSTPFFVFPRWKCLCERMQTLILVRYKKSDEVTKLSNVRLRTPTGDATEVKSLPAGTLHVDKKECEWNLGTITNTQEIELMARLGTKQTEDTQVMWVEFDVQDELGSQVTLGTDQGSDRVQWARVDVVRKSCRYNVQFKGHVLHGQ